MHGEPPPLTGIEYLKAFNEKREEGRRIREYEEGDAVLYKRLERDRQKLDPKWTSVVVDKQISPLTYRIRVQIGQSGKWRPVIAHLNQLRTDPTVNPRSPPSQASDRGVADVSEATKGAVSSSVVNPLSVGMMVMWRDVWADPNENPGCEFVGKLLIGRVLEVISHETVRVQLFGTYFNTSPLAIKEFRLGWLCKDNKEIYKAMGPREAKPLETTLPTDVIVERGFELGQRGRLPTWIVEKYRSGMHHLREHYVFAIGKVVEARSHISNLRESRQKRRVTFSSEFPKYRDTKSEIAPERGSRAEWLAKYEAMLERNRKLREIENDSEEDELGEEAVLVAHTATTHSSLDISKMTEREKSLLQEAKEVELERFREKQVYEKVRIPAYSQVREAGGTGPRGRPLDMKWVLTEKRLGDGSKKYKARLVARGDQDRREGLDKSTSVPPVHALRAIMSYATGCRGFSKKCLLQTDVKTAYLHASLDEPVLVSPPRDHTDSGKWLWKVSKAVYGLPEAGRRFEKFLEEKLLNL
jgi:hypothetical protein